MAIADGFIAVWHLRYHDNFWRVVTAIRFPDTDGHSVTEPDLSWGSFLNTPPIPDYPSTHSVLDEAAAVPKAHLPLQAHVRRNFY